MYHNDITQYVSAHILSLVCFQQCGQHCSQSIHVPELHLMAGAGEEISQVTENLKQYCLLVMTISCPQYTE
jgi:hypothetical protein